MKSALIILFNYLLVFVLWEYWNCYVLVSEDECAPNNECSMPKVDDSEKIDQSQQTTPTSPNDTGEWEYLNYVYMNNWLLFFSHMLRWIE